MRILWSPIRRPWADRKMKDYICKNCGKEYTPKYRSQMTFCGRPCYYEYRIAHRKKYICKNCGKKYILDKRVATEAHCSACRTKAPPHKYPRTIGYPHLVTCPTCGKSRETIRYKPDSPPKTWYCSKRCSDLYQITKHRKCGVAA